MSGMLLVGTTEGVYELGLGGPHDAAGNRPTSAARLGGRTIGALAADAAGWWAVVDEVELWRGEADGAAAVTATPLAARSLLATAAGLWVGTAEAHLLHLRGAALERVTAFDLVAGRDRWHTPWGGPPDTRSLAVGPDRALYANVHVGGVPRSDDGGATWRPTIDIDADVHQVVVDARSGTVLCATARGLAASSDRGDTWTFRTEGLHAPYCRALATTGEHLLVSASEGPGGRRARVYRGRVDGGDALEPCRTGLPGWFDANVDTACLAARGAVAALGTRDGRVFLSGDAGVTWRLARNDLPEIRCLLLRA